MLSRRPRTHILVLNYNGRELLAECLPSVSRAAESSSRDCRVTVVDNSSTDGSLEWLEAVHPSVEIVRRPNLGLVSFNDVLAGMSERVVLLLNNDVKLHPSAVDPLVDAVEGSEDALFAAPQCWTFDGLMYEGMRTRVRSRFGLVQGLCRVPGHERWTGQGGLTASAGPVLAVDRRRFLETGGYDPLYLPGRLEDLDLGFRGWLAGYRGYYVPESMALHRGFGSFGPAFGAEGCDRLAMRNTLLFCWKNLKGRRLAGHLAWLAVRAAHATVTGRSMFLGALREARAIWKESASLAIRPAIDRASWLDRQESFFRELGWENG